MKLTGIQWTHSTINPTSGCDGCELIDNGCYAQIVHENRLALNPATAPNYAKDFREVRLIPGRMAKAAAWGPVTDNEAKDKPWIKSRRRHIFISDMTDALSRDVPFDFLKREIIDVVTSEKGRRHVWQWLTKRPQRMAEFDRWLADQGIAWPENLWAGTSITSQRTTKVRMLPLLLVRAKVRFLSCEPLFEGVHLGLREFRTPPAAIHWVIVGGASGHRPAPFNVAWARSIVKQCYEAGVRCFVKQMGSNPVFTVFEGFEERDRKPVRDESVELLDAHGGDWSEWPDDLRVREMPLAV